TSGLVTASCPGAPQFNGLALEDHTGALITLVDPGPGYVTGWMASPCGAFVPLAPPPPGGWGVPSGLVEIPSLQPFGPATAPGHQYRWLVRPNAGSLPLVGHLGFGLEGAGAPATTAGLWGLP